MKLALVVPCYNEEEVLEDTTKQLCELFDQLQKKVRGASSLYFLKMQERISSPVLISKSCQLPPSYHHGLHL